MIKFSVFRTLVHCSTLLAALTLSACGGSSNNNNNQSCAISAPTFTAIYNGRIATTCASSGACHAAPATVSQLDMSSKATAYTNLNKPAVESTTLQRIKPSDPNPQHSFLYLKVTGSTVAGTRMPLDLPALADCELTAISDWIKAMSPNN